MRFTPREAMPWAAREPLPGALALWVGDSLHQEATAVVQLHLS